ncbi:hypothetical protein HN51_031227 [Arachis hypogaea]
MTRRREDLQVVRTKGADTTTAALNRPSGDVGRKPDLRWCGWQLLVVTANADSGRDGGDDDDGQVLPISGLRNTAMTHPNDPEFIELGIFECMAALIWKGLKNWRWLSHDQNIYIPYYAAYTIGSYTMNMEEFSESAVHAGVIPALVELLRGKLTWVEQRVAV